MTSFQSVLDTRMPDKISHICISWQTSKECSTLNLLNASLALIWRHLMVSVSSYNRENGCPLINFTNAIHNRNFLRCTVTTLLIPRSAIYDHPIFKHPQILWKPNTQIVLGSGTSAIASSISNVCWNAGSLRISYRMTKTQRSGNDNFQMAILDCLWKR